MATPNYVQIFVSYVSTESKKLASYMHEFIRLMVNKTPQVYAGTRIISTKPRNTEKP